VHDGTGSREERQMHRSIPGWFALAVVLSAGPARADDTSTVQTSYAYEPFGATTVNGQSNSSPFQYTGRENDGTGLYYYRARYYKPEFHRFISEDPILAPLVPSQVAGPTGTTPFGLLHSYAYAENKPITLRDPYGLFPTPEVLCAVGCTVGCLLLVKRLIPRSICIAVCHALCTGITPSPGAGGTCQ